MAIVDQALWIVERYSGRELSLPAIARASGVSRSHLASATGVPLIGYLRARRLSLAAVALAAGAADILGVALDAGYGSHEAFTRAFRDQFGRTPERVREDGSTRALALVPPLDLPVRHARTLPPPRLVEAGAVRAVGLPRRHTLDTVIGIPIQWQDFTARHARIPHRCRDIPIGLLSPMDEEGSFEYLCATEVSAFGPVPDGLVGIELPPGRHAVFEHQAHVSTIFDTCAAIWNEALPARGWTPADAPGIERHHASFDPGSGEGGLSIHVPLFRSE